MKSSLLKASILLLVIALSQCTMPKQKKISTSPITHIIFLGTGTPNPDPYHSGISVCIQVRGVPYVFDCGPGVVRKAAEVSKKYKDSVKIDITKLNTIFITHLHSDHTTGLPDFILTPWVMGRNKPVELYGPVGSEAMVNNILEAWKEDIQIRLNGLEQADKNGWRVNTHEIKDEGIFYKDSNITVEAIKVEHGSWEYAYAYLIRTPDKKIVLSGDTRPCANLISKSKGTDILIHEVYSAEKLKYRTPKWQKYHPQFHTSTTELADIASQVKPGLLILYHQLFWGQTDEQLVGEITKTYKGKVVSAKDLDVY